jgi:hypothetical protein
VLCLSPELMLLCLLTSALTRGPLELLPAFAGGVYQRGSTGLAMLTTAGGVGAVIGGFVLSRAGRSSGLSTLARGSATWLGVLVIALGLAPGFFTGTVVVFVLSLLGVICGVGLQVLLQKTLDENFRGRVLGLWGMCNVAGPAVGGALVGGGASIERIPFGRARDCTGGGPLRQSAAGRPQVRLCRALQPRC